MKKSPVIALVTDFGYSDAYVGSMKGIILRIASHARIVDITHTIPPQNVDSGAYVLWSAYKYFPQGTIFVAVVDPGVGSERKILCLKTRRHTFLAPDNGLLKYILESEPSARLISVTNKKYFLPFISSTFHGRDIFAPVAAYLAKGISLSLLGKKTTPITKAEHFVRVTTKGSYVGKIIHIDRFGNIVTNFQCNANESKKMMLYFGKQKVEHFYRTYNDAQRAIPFLIIGSSGLLEISVKNGNAVALLKPKPSQSLRLNVE